VPLLWFPASALGMSVVVPLVLGLARRETRELFQPQRLPNTLLYLLMIGAATAAIFSGAEFPWLFFIFPPLLFLVVRLGLSGGVLGAAWWRPLEPTSRFQRAADRWRSCSIQASKTAS
jgi:integral membrane sensor domain MASE1